MYILKFTLTTRGKFIHNTGGYIQWFEANVYLHTFVCQVHPVSKFLTARKKKQNKITWGNSWKDTARFQQLLRIRTIRIVTHFITWDKFLCQVSQMFTVWEWSQLVTAFNVRLISCDGLVKVLIVLIVVSLPERTENIYARKNCCFVNRAPGRFWKTLEPYTKPNTWKSLIFLQQYHDKGNQYHDRKLQLMKR